MEPAVVAVMRRMMAALEVGDKATAMACFAPDAVLFDPHYPKPEMHGRAEIEKGLEWGLSVMERFGFTVETVFLDGTGKKAAFEVDTNHVLKGGRKLRFPQVFIAEERDGLVTALRAYEPYGPNGIGGFFLGLERLKRRIAG
ncbi:MAG TPA: nuclear transport factor 2 family protein [Rhizobiales bacterium]|nr:nuclear transport factor 2 family protein [Hyphomicrobiales bacterium]